MHYAQGHATQASWSIALSRWWLAIPAVWACAKQKPREIPVICQSFPQLSIIPGLIHCNPICLRNTGLNDGQNMPFMVPPPCSHGYHIVPQNLGLFMKARRFIGLCLVLGVSSRSRTYWQEIPKVSILDWAFRRSVR